MSDHDPLCPIVDKAAWPFGGSCLCDLIRQAEQRGRKAEWVNQQDEMQAAHDRGYERGQRDALAIDDKWQSGYESGKAVGRDDALAAAVQRVEALRTHTLVKPPYAQTQAVEVVTITAVIAAIKGDSDE